jgi:hypothetical protein
LGCSYVGATVPGYVDNVNTLCLSTGSDPCLEAQFSAGASDPGVTPGAYITCYKIDVFLEYCCNDKVAG